MKWRLRFWESHQQTDKERADDYPLAFWAGKQRRDGKDSERSGRSPGNFAVLYFPSGEADHEAAAKRNCKV